MKKYFKPYNIIRVLVCLIVLFLIVFPFLWLILSTFKMQKDIIKWPPTLWPKRWTIQNYIKVWDRIPLASYIKNTVIFAGAVSVCSALVDSLAGYAFARLQFKGREVIFNIVLLTMLIPFQIVGALMCEIEGTDIFRRNLSTGGRAMLRAAAECLPAEDERRKDFLTASMEEGDYPVLHKICPQAESLLGSTIAFTMIEGGTAFNVMPRKAVLTANVRVSALETKEEVTERLTAVAKKHDLLCEFVGGKDAVRESDTRQPGYQMMKASVNQVYPGLPVIPFVLGGGTDSRHFQELTEEIVRFSPMYAEPWQGRGVHGDNEAANIEAVQDAARCYRALLLEL